MENVLDMLHSPQDDVSDTQAVLDMLHGIVSKSDQEVDYFASRSLLPLGTKKQFGAYEQRYVPPEAELNLVLPKGINNPLNMAHICATGKAKTRETKNFVLGFTKVGYRCLVVQPKSFDWEVAAEQGEGTRIHQNMKNTKLKVKAYVPSYLRTKVPKGKEKEYHIFSPDISLFTTSEDWQSLGVSQVASNNLASHVLESVNKAEANGEKPKITLEDLRKSIQRDRKMNPASKGAANNVLDLLERIGYFGSKRIDFVKDWAEGCVIVVVFFAQYSGLMNVIISKLVDEVKDIGVAEGDRVSKKMLVFEDTAFYIKPGTRLVEQQVYNIQHNYRAYGMNSLLVFQLPKLIPETLLDGARIKIIGKINNPEVVRDQIPKRAYKILRQDEERFGALVDDEKNFVFERLVIKGSDVYRYFPWDCLVGHPNPEEV